MQGRAARLACTAVMALGLASGAQAAPRSALSADGLALTLYPGEQVTVRLGAGGMLNVVSIRPAQAAEALPPKPRARGPDGPLQGADPDTVALLLGGRPGQTVLKLESGLSLAFDYRATLRLDRGGRAIDQPTGVCTVLPLLAAFEVWPYAVASVTLSRFATRPTNEVVCPDPSKPEPTKMETHARWPSTPKPANS